MSNTTYPGMMPITQKSFTNGATNPRTDAIQRQINMNEKQNLINQSGQGKRSRRHRRGGASNNNLVAVPQFQMQYSPVGGPGTNPNDQVAIGAKNGMQASADSVYDNQAKLGGKRRCRKGGNPDWLWGCYSGGRSKRRLKRKSKKNHKKTTRYHSR